MESQPLTPPRLATWLLELTLPTVDGEALAGDLCEEYRAHIVPDRGLRQANWWYRRQVARSLAPLVFRAWQRASVARASLAVGGAAMLAAAPAVLLLALRGFVLQQVPLKTTSELSAGFAVLLATVAIAATGGAIAAAVRLLLPPPRR
jgi:hypothetical protein